MIYSFFTDFERYLLLNRIKPKILPGGPVNLTQLNVPTYVNICYSIFVFMLIAGITNVIAYGMNNTDVLNTDKILNHGLTISQMTFSSIIVLLSIVALFMHHSINSINNFKSYEIKYDIAGFTKTLNNTDVKIQNSKIGYSVFAILFFSFTFFYGLLTMIFSADRFVCTTSGSCSMTKLSDDDKRLLEVPGEKCSKPLVCPS